MRTIMGLCATCVLLLIPTTWGETPHIMNFQGRLTSGSGSALPDDAYSIAFRIYDDSTSGNVIWSETQSINTFGGTFSVLLGSVNPLTAGVFAGGLRYVGVQVEGEAEITPRASLAAVPYAFQAGSTSTTAASPDTAWVAPYFRVIDEPGSLALTYISVYNADTTNNEVTLSFYSELGALIDECSKTIGPGQLWLFKSNIGPCPNVTYHEGYVIVRAQGPVAPSGLYMAQSYGSPTTQVSSANLTFYKL